ncbi:MAG: hypothetical protein K5685_12285 [Bacteroidales bacterium]|nr:hypothetical protein [Bacteroidales bacterium]
MSENKISIANIIALLGFAGLGVIIFFGLLFDMKPIGTAVIMSAVLIAALVLLLFMCIKAKGATDNPDKWKIVEWVFLALYIVAAFLPYYLQPFMRFFYVSNNKTELQTVAAADFEKLNNYYSDYDQWREQQLDNVQEKITLFREKSQKFREQHQSMNDFMQGVASDVDEWRKDANELTKPADFSELESLRDQISLWKYMKLASAAYRLDQIMMTASDDLQERLKTVREENKLIPEISDNFEITDYKTYDKTLSESSEFKAMMTSDFKYSAFGIFLYILLHLLILLNYLVAKGNSVVGIRKRNGQIGGLPL